MTIPNRPILDIRVEKQGDKVWFKLQTHAAVEWMLDYAYYENAQMVGPRVMAVDFNAAPRLIDSARARRLLIA